MSSEVGTMRIFILLGLIFLVTGCAVKGEEKELVMVSPESAVVTLGAPKQFTASPANLAVTWSVDAVQGKTVGTVDSNGFYTAPSDATSSPEKVIIRATDPSSGSAGAAIAFLTTFKANKRLSTHYTEGTARANTYSAGQRSIAVFQGSNGNINVYVVWSDKSLGLFRIWFAKSSNGGNTFDTPVPIDEVSFADQISPAIAVDGSGNVFVVWEDYSEGDADIFIKKYDGTGFGARTKVNVNLDVDTVGYDTSPSIAINSTGEIYVVWEHRSDYLDDYPDIYFAISTSQGQSFSQPSWITTSGRRPTIAIDPSSVAYVVWEDLTQFPNLPTHVMINRIVGGISGTLKQVDDSTLPFSYHARFPSVSVGPGGKVYVVWQRGLILNPGFSGEIISTYDIDLATVDGNTLDIISTPVLFPDDPNTGFYGGPAYPAITSDTNNVYVAWDDLRNGAKDIYFARSSNGGITFTTNRIVNDDTGTWHEKPGIAVSDGKAYIIWTDYRNSSLVTTISPNDVFFAREG